MSRSPRHTVVVAALAIAFALAATPIAGGADAPITAGPPVTFQDPIGDSGTAPDMTAVVVSNDANGRLSFSILIPGVQLATNARVFLVLNTDIDRTTGDPETSGGDYYFVIRGANMTYTLFRWDGSVWQPATSTTASVRYAAGAHIAIDRSELGDTDEFSFYAKTRTDGDGPETGRVDFVPDSGSETYVLPREIPAPPAVSLVSVAAVKAGVPRAGGRFDVRVSAILDVGGSRVTVPPSALTCTATVAGRRVRTSVRSARSGARACALVIPPNSRGKQLVISLRGTVVHEGTDFRASFTKTVRSRIR